MCSRHRLRDVAQPGSVPAWGAVIEFKSHRSKPSYCYILKILITNDDGLFSESTAIMLEHLSKYYDCLAITPSSNMSGSSNSLF